MAPLAIGHAPSKARGRVPKETDWLQYGARVLDWGCGSGRDEEAQWVDGNEEPTGSWVSLIAKGETITVEVSEGWYIYVSEPTHLSLVQQ